MKKPKAFLIIICLCFSLAVQIAAADVKLPAVFADNMVLQRKTKAPVWGWADPGEKIRIKASWRWFGTSTAADKDGNWFVKIPTPKAGGPYTITISGQNQITLDNVLIGEVWLCAGQSNMGRTVRGSTNGKSEVAAADYPRIRLFSVKGSKALSPQKDCIGSWSQCSPETAAKFSGVGYYFGRVLHKELNVPIGLIHSSDSGTPAEAWTKMEALESVPELAPIIARYKKASEDLDKAKAEHDKQMADWEKAVRKAQSEGEPLPLMPYLFAGPGHFQSPSCRYNAMLAPLIPYRIRGAIWYQGEANTGRAYQYRKLFSVMIANWRNDWNQGMFPFYYVQLPPFRYIGEPIAAEIRESQLMTLSVPNTGMAVTMDLADPGILHPGNKLDIGKRLALWALAKTYGRKNLVYSGPIYKSMKIERRSVIRSGGQDSETVIRLFFGHTGSGLVAKGGKLTHFAIAGADRKFVEAGAEIDSETNTIVVSSPDVKDPVAVRFAWSNTAVPNFYNAEELPASSFRTDDWPCITQNRK